MLQICKLNFVNFTNFSQIKRVDFFKTVKGYEGYVNRAVYINETSTVDKLRALRCIVIIIKSRRY